METIDHASLRGEAEECRHKALAYLGRPEADFLIRAAKAFDELADGDGRFAFRRQPDGNSA
ncbi:MAG: hypothetical protein H0V46_03885 [Sphingomonas sp.]|nr:hypothetical protein [Sphingomonas sp.]